MNTEQNTSNNCTSRLRAAWTDIRHAQRRMDELNRPWIAAPRRSS